MKIHAPLAAALAIAGSAHALDLASFEKRVTTRVLDNGLTLIVCERPTAPVFSYVTLVDVGGAQEVPGITGIAHMFEHMAFKGTDTIGTTDYAAEKGALETVEEAYAAYDRERRREIGRDEAKVKTLEKAWRDAMAEADKYVVRNHLGDLLEREGVPDLNASTGYDVTSYKFSMPSNRFELLVALESERFLRPVLREFYKERDVVREERRAAESSPGGRLHEQFRATAFTAHPYGQALIGWPSDLASISATDARRFYEQYYVASNMVFAVAGDVTAREAMPILERYFGRFPKKPKPEPLRTVEPPQRSERRVVLKERAQPMYFEGYHKPASSHPDEAVYDVIAGILASGRTGRLYRALVRDKPIAMWADASNNYPATKYPHLFVLSGFTLPGSTTQALAEGLHAEIERLKNEDVTEAELARVKTLARAGLIRSLDSNRSLADRLAMYQLRAGDWRDMFREVDRVQKVTAADVRRVAGATFTPENRTVGMIETVAPEGGAR